MKVFYIDSGSAKLPMLRDELSGIQARHTMAAVLYGSRATLKEINRQASEATADILHIAGDFGQLEKDGPFGFILNEANKEYLGLSEIHSIAVAIDAKLVFLNGCLTVIIADELVKLGVPAVISTTSRATIPDASAWAFSNYFYSELLKNNGDIKAAHDKYENRLYTWDSNGRYDQLRIDHAIAPLVERMDAYDERAERRGENINRLALIMVGNTIIVATSLLSLLSWLMLK